MVEDFEDPELEALVEQGLAEIAAYADIRAKWPSESSDFTPWLGDNIHLLGAELGMKLSDVRREFRIGADRADLRATASDGRTVIIECQLDRSDNGHFGQIMAYGSGVDADVLVWIAADFRDKHREAFDWINTKTGPACEFYAVKVGIGKGCEGCTGQPQLNLVARPRAYRELIDPKDLASCALDDEDLAVLTLLYQGSKVDEVASKFDWSLSKAKHRASAITEFNRWLQHWFAGSIVVVRRGLRQGFSIRVGDVPWSGGVCRGLFVDVVSHRAMVSENCLGISREDTTHDGSGPVCLARLACPTEAH